MELMTLIVGVLARGILGWYVGGQVSRMIFDDGRKWQGVLLAIALVLVVIL